MARIFYVGIDVAQKTNKSTCLNETGEKIGNLIVFRNNQSGANILADELLKRLPGFERLLIGTEATSFYDFHLLEFLADHSGLAQFKPELYRFNAKLIKNFKKAYSSLPKNDDKDSWVIAARLRFGDLPYPFRPNLAHRPLKRLTRFRYHTAHQLTREKNYFLSHLFLKFSEYRNVKPFSNTFGATSITVITEFLSPDEILNMPMEKLIEFVVTKGKNRFPDSQKIVDKLQKIARESYRLRPNLEKTLNLVLALSYRNIRQLAKTIKELDKVIEQELAAFENTLQTISGIGPVYAAGLFAEIGNAAYFPREAQLAKFAGLFWTEHQSGDFKAEETRMVKAANKYLRYYFIEAANMVRSNLPEYRDYYRRKYNETIKHKHKRALVLTARKLVRLIHAMLKNGTIYRPPSR